MAKVRKDILYPELSYLITGFCYQIHNKLGRYRGEKEYADALELFLKENNLNYSREIPLPPSFTGEKNRRNIPDFIIEDKIIIDLKAKRIINKDDYYQMRRYLIAFNKELGIVVNFREYYLNPKRILNSEIKKINS